MNAAIGRNHRYDEECEATVAEKNWDFANYLGIATRDNLARWRGVRYDMTTILKGKKRQQEQLDH